MRNRSVSDHRMPRRRHLLNGDGFTLVELLLAIIVLGIATMGIAGLYNIMKVTQVHAMHLDTATRAARTEIEVLRNNSYNSLDPGSTINFTSSLPGSLPRDRNGTVAVSEPLSGLRKVDVTITYTDFGKPQTVKLTSEIGIIGIGQAQ